MVNLTHAIREWVSGEEAQRLMEPTSIHCLAFAVLACIAITDEQLRHVEHCPRCTTLRGRLLS